jgi:O-antigen/teichoic acid export membrane protein
MLKTDRLNLTQKIAYNAVFSSVARILEMIIGLVIIKLTTNYLGLDGFGDYGTVMAFVYIFSVLADFGLYSIVVREISDKDANEEKVINNAFTIRIVLGALVMSSAYLFSFLLPYSNEVRFGVLIASFGYWIFNAIQVMMGLFQKHLAMDKVSVAEFLGRLAQFVVIILCVRYNLGFYLTLVALFIGGIFNLFFVFLYSKKLIRLRLAFDFSIWRDLIIKAFPLAVSAVLVLVYFKLDTVLLSVMKESRDVGIYSLAYRVMETLIFFPSMIVGLTMPLMSRFAFEDREKFKSIVQRTLNFLLLAIVPVVLGIFVVSEKLIYLLSKPEFSDSIIVLRILAVALGFIFLGALFSNVIIALKKQKHLAYIYFVGAVFNVVVNLTFIPKYSYFGAAWTTLATEFLVTALMLFVIYKEVRFLPSFRGLFKCSVAGLIMVLVLQGLYFMNIFLLALIGALVYGSVIYFIGGVSKEDMSKLFQKRV